MTDRVSRRDFLNGTALMAAGSMLPADPLRGQPQAAYPPGLTGLRGSHDWSFDVAHALARDGKKFAIDDLSVDDTYDLVVWAPGSPGCRRRGSTGSGGRTRKS